MEDRIKFLETFKPLHSKGIDKPLQERKFPIGVVCSIIAHYSKNDVPLHSEESDVDRSMLAYEFLEESELSPWHTKTPLEVIFEYPQQSMCDYETTLKLMDAFTKFVWLYPKKYY